MAAKAKKRSITEKVFGWIAIAIIFSGVIILYNFRFPKHEVLQVNEKTVIIRWTYKKYSEIKTYYVNAGSDTAKQEGN